MTTIETRRSKYSYRRSGATEWKQALPLLRIGGERVFRAAEHLDYTVPDRFAGSILDLDPDTEYEVRLSMKDPDGVAGQAVQTAKVRTRGEPKAAAGGRTLHVYPPDWKGQKQEPAFLGLNAAYYGAGLGDWNEVYERKAQPGDVILVHAGLYKGNRLNYVDPLGIPFDGAYVLTLKGTPEKPIVIRGAGDGEAIFDGAGSFRLFDVMAADYHIFEGLTIRNTDVAFWAGLKDVLGPKGLTVRNCRIENVGIGINAQYAGSTDFYIADNIFLGRDDPHRVLGWASPDIYGRTRSAELLCGQGLRFRPRDLSQRGRVLSRWHRRQHARNAGDGAGSEGGRDRHLQQRHSRDRRRFHRVRWRRAQYPCDAQSRHQCGAHRAQRAAGVRRSASISFATSSTMRRRR